MTSDSIGIERGGERRICHFLLLLASDKQWP